jgi:cytochrome c biogenesis protein CcmG/thiol:disulfide interchange protein DsbE
MKKVILLAALFTWAPLVAADPGLNLPSYEGKVVVVDFWASWCVPCRRSFPWMNDMHDKYAADGLVIIAVNLDRSADDAAQFLAEYPTKFEIAYDPTGVLAKKYGVEVMPSSIVIGRNGEMIERHAGFKVKQQDEYEATIRAALKLEKEK